MNELWSDSWIFSLAARKSTANQTTHKKQTFFTRPRCQLCSASEDNDWLPTFQVLRGKSTRVFRETRQGGRCLTQFSAQLAISCLFCPSSSWEGGGGGGHPTWLEWKVGWLGKRDNLITWGSFFLNTGFSRKRRIPRKSCFAFLSGYVSEQNN